MKRKVLSIATFNLYNLNEPGLPIYDDTGGWSQEEYDRKIEWTARQIALSRPDVMAFQEMWHRASIERALEKANLQGEYQILAPASADGSKIHCGAIVRRDLPTGTPEWIERFPDKFILESKGEDPQTPAVSVSIRGFSRPVLHFTITPRSDQPPIHVFVCHFKSKGPTKIFQEPWYKPNKSLYSKHATNLGAALSTIRRTAEAAALRFILTELMKANDTPVLALGDINDGQLSNTANILTEQPRYLVGDSIGGADNALYTAQTLQEYRDTRDVYYTHVHQGIRESLDHILFSEQFYDHSRKRVWLFDGLRVNNDHLDWENHKENGTNDHGIIEARFKYKPVKP